MFKCVHIQVYFVVLLVIFFLVINKTEFKKKILIYLYFIFVGYFFKPRNYDQ